MFIERLIYRNVKDRLQWYIDDPRRFEKFLRKGGLTAQEAADGRLAFMDQPPEINHGYARQGGIFPCYCLVLGSENTAQDWIGEDALPIDEDGQMYVDPDTGNRIDIHARRWEHRFDWYVYADHPDLALYYYYLLRHMMVGLRSRLQDEDLDEITYSGAELAPDPRYMPADMFTRRFSITCRADEDYVEDYKPGVGEGTSIIGLRSDDGPEIPDELTVDEQEELSNARYNVSIYTEDPNV